MIEPLIPFLPGFTINHTDYLSLEAYAFSQYGKDWDNYLDGLEVDPSKADGIRFLIETMYGSYADKVIQGVNVDFTEAA